MRFLTVLALIVLGTAMAGCGDDVREIVLAETDSGQEIQLMTGDRFEVRLESNPSTGYEWRVDPGSESVLTLASSDFEPPDDDLVGSAGLMTFVFDAGKPGATVLRLEYVRPFDDPVIPDRVIEYIIRVDGVPFTRSTTPLDTSRTSAPPLGPDDVITIPQLLADHEAGHVTVAGYVFWDNNGARVCEVLRESFPPQCGGEWLPLTDPTQLGLDLEESQGIRWTDQPVEISAYFDGQQLELLDQTTSGGIDE